MRTTGKRVTAVAAAFVVLGSLTGSVMAQPKTEPKAEQKLEQKAGPKAKKEKFGKGEMEIAEDLATQSGKSMDEILAMRKAGKGWGQIARELDVKLGPTVRNGKRDEDKPGKKAKPSKEQKKAAKAKEEKKDKQAAEKEKK